MDTQIPISGTGLIGVYFVSGGNQLVSPAEPAQSQVVGVLWGTDSAGVPVHKYELSVPIPNDAVTQSGTLYNRSAVVGAQCYPTMVRIDDFRAAVIFRSLGGDIPGGSVSEHIVQWMVIFKRVGDTLVAGTPTLVVDRRANTGISGRNTYLDLDPSLGPDSYAWDPGADGNAAALTGANQITLGISSQRWDALGTLATTAWLAVRTITVSDVNVASMTNIYAFQLEPTWDGNLQPIAAVTVKSGQVTFLMDKGYSPSWLFPWNINVSTYPPTAQGAVLNTGTVPGNTVSWWYVYMNKVNSSLIAARMWGNAGGGNVEHVWTFDPLTVTPAVDVVPVTATFGEGRGTSYSVYAPTDATPLGGVLVATYSMSHLTVDELRISSTGSLTPVPGTTPCPVAMPTINANTAGPPQYAAGTNMTFMYVEDAGSYWIVTYQVELPSVIVSALGNSRIRFAGQ